MILMGMGRRGGKMSEQMRLQRDVGGTSWEVKDVRRIRHLQQMTSQVPAMRRWSSLRGSPPQH